MLDALPVYVIIGYFLASFTLVKQTERVNKDITYVSYVHVAFWVWLFIAVVGNNMGIIHCRELSQGMP